jgi:hypothetical protein
LALAAPLGAIAAAEDYPGFAWMSGVGDGNAVLTYGSPETGEDYLFNLICGQQGQE